MQKLLVLLIFLITSVPVFAQTILSGKIGNMSIDASGNPFVIADNLTVPFGKTLKIGEGTVLLFKPFTGLIIEGSLVVEGSIEKPVVFTTENDSRFNSAAKQAPNPFDWNGILITQKAQTVRLMNFTLEYSVYGVKSQKEEFIISNGNFVHNGQFHVTVKDAIKNVVDDIPFNFGKELTEDTVQSSTPDKMPKMTVSSDDPGHKRTLIKPFSIGLGVVGLAAAGVGGYFFYSSNRYDSKYQSATSQKDADEYFDKRNSSLTAGVVCVTGGGISIVSGIVLFALNHAKEKDVTVAPIFGTYNGISIVCNY